MCGIHVGVSTRSTIVHQAVTMNICHKGHTMLKGRIFISSPVDDHLDDRRRRLKAAIVHQVTESGFQPQQFLVSGIPKGMSWNFTTVDEVMRRCHGALVFAFPRWTTTANGQTISFPTEYNHYEGALANAYNLPVLTIAEMGIAERGIAWNGGGNVILWIPSDADVDWLSSETFKHRFGVWAETLGERRDVFLGYSGQAKTTAQAINLYMKSLDISVMDWSMDFFSGGTILEEIERAARLCTCGIFLFTRDDLLESPTMDRAAPRDNVVFEAGYFIATKGKEKVLIIREDGAKMPADIGGNIYLHLSNRSDTERIETALRQFLERRL